MPKKQKEKINVLRSTRIKLVSGYHTVTPIPPKCIREILPYRFAVIQESNFNDKVDMHFDYLLFVALLQSLLEVLQANSFKAYSEMPKFTIFGSPPTRLTPIACFQDLNDHFKALPAADREPPALVYFFKMRKLVAFGIAENWFKIGGPEPYHDSFTFSLFSEIRDPIELYSACTRATKIAGANVAEFVQSETVLPLKPLTPMRTIRDWIFRKLGDL